MPDSLRWTDQDVPLQELDTGNVNIDSLLINEELEIVFAKADSIVSGRPVSYYLSRPDVSQNAKDLYLRKFIPSADEKTFEIGDSLLSKNKATLPFYFFLFTKILRIAKGGLSYKVFFQAANFALYNPNEFFLRISEPNYRIYYSIWCQEVANGIEQDVSRSPIGNMKQYVITEQTKHAKPLTPFMKEKILIFADSVASVRF